MPRGLVSIHIDRDHEFETRQGAIQPRAVGGRQHRVAGKGDESPDATLALRLHLLGHRRGGQFAAELG